MGRRVLRALGFRTGPVILSVLAESMALALLGGLLGTVMAFGLSQITEVLIRQLLPYAPTGSLILLDFKLIFMTLIAVLVIGLVSGVYPSWKAARVRPLESIRNEMG